MSSSAFLRYQSTGESALEEPHAKTVRRLAAGPFGSNHAIRLLRQVGFAGILTITVGCSATSSIVRDLPAVVPNVMAICPVFVMWPTSAHAAFQGNVGVTASDIESLVANRILGVVREQCASSELVRPTLATSVAAIPGYTAALGGAGITTLELRAATSALERGASHLLVPTIERWNQSRTDDPIGAFMTPKNRIAVSVRLMHLESPAVEGRITFTNRSRITLNRAAARLLDDDFNAALRVLLGDRLKSRTSKPNP
jgi:hypothetical protein